MKVLPLPIVDCRLSIVDCTSIVPPSRLQTSIMDDAHTESAATFAHAGGKKRIKDAIKCLSYHAYTIISKLKFNKLRVDA